MKHTNTQQAAFALTEFAEREIRDPALFTKALLLILTGVVQVEAPNPQMAEILRVLADLAEGCEKALDN